MNSWLPGCSLGEVRRASAAADSSVEGIYSSRGGAVSSREVSSKAGAGSCSVGTPVCSNTASCSTGTSVAEPTSTGWDSSTTGIKPAFSCEAACTASISEAGIAEVSSTAGAGSGSPRGEIASATAGASEASIAEVSSTAGAGSGSPGGESASAAAGASATAGMGAASSNDESVIAGRLMVVSSIDVSSSSSSLLSFWRNNSVVASTCSTSTATGSSAGTDVLVSWIEPIQS